MSESQAFIYGTLAMDLAVEAPSLKWKVLGLFCGAHVAQKSIEGILILCNVLLRFNYIIQIDLNPFI